jgi:hypothetical protein
MINLQMRKFSNSFVAAFILIIFSLTISAQKLNPQLLPGTETKRINAQGLKELLPKADKRQPLLLNFWATWCGLAMRNFPIWLKLIIITAKKV